MICEIMLIVFGIWYLNKRSKLKAKLKDAETVEVHYPDGSFSYIDERDLL